MKFVSGMVVSSLWTARVDCVTWSSVAFACVFTIPKMMPWSSAGASSLGDCVNIASASTPITTQAV